MPALQTGRRLDRIELQFTEDGQQTRALDLYYRQTQILDGVEIFCDRSLTVAPLASLNGSEIGQLETVLGESLTAALAAADASAAQVSSLTDQLGQATSDLDMMTADRNNLGALLTTTAVERNAAVAALTAITAERDAALAQISPAGDDQ